MVMVYPAARFMVHGICVPFRVGMGFDVHRFERTSNTEQYIYLCGVKIAHTKGIIAHSDGDVALHALTDALLGCIGAGGIGVHFPNDNPRWRGIRSSHFVLEAHKMVVEKSYSILNCDITIVCEQPKITPHVPLMKQKMHQLLGLENSRINIKAVTTESLGFLGRKEGIAAYAVVLCNKL